jgi:hypothetical protein
LIPSEQTEAREEAAQKKEKKENQALKLKMTFLP